MLENELGNYCAGNRFTADWHGSCILILTHFNCATDLILLILHRAQMQCTRIKNTTTRHKIPAIAEIADRVYIAINNQNSWTCISHAF
jgi:hypothetical protein